jgi:hypothetical protein
LIRLLSSSSSIVMPLIALPARRTRTHWTIGSELLVFQATRAVPVLPVSEKPAEGFSSRIETEPARLSALASWATRARQAGSLEQPLMRAIMPA